MGNICCCASNVPDGVEEVYHDEPDGAPMTPKEKLNKSISAPVQNPYRYIRQKSETQEGKHKTHLNEHIRFITLLKEMAQSSTGLLKKALNEEIKLAAVQSAVQSVFQELMSSAEGKMKIAVLEDIRCMGIAKISMEHVGELKASLTGVLKAKVLDELISLEQQHLLQRQFSLQIKSSVDALNESVRPNSVYAQRAVFAYNDEVDGESDTDPCFTATIDTTQCISDEHDLDADLDTDGVPVACVADGDDIEDEL